MASLIGGPGLLSPIAAGWSCHPSVATEPVSNLSIPKEPHFQSTFEALMPCGEIQGLCLGKKPAGGRDLLGALAAASLLGGAATLFFSPSPSPRFLAAAGDWTDVNALLLIASLPMLAAACFLIVRAVKSSKSSATKPEPVPMEPAGEARRPRKTERLRRTLPLPPEPQPCAPTRELSLGLAPMPSLHDADTGPITVAGLQPSVTSGPDDRTRKYASGAVQAAMPDDPTKAEGVPSPSRMGDTVRLIEGEAAPKGAWQGPGTEPIVMRRKTETLLEAFPAISVAPRKGEFSIEAPVWTPADHLDVLRGFRGPKGHGLIKPEILESAIGVLEGNASTVGIGRSGATSVVAYLRLIRMGIACPFDLERELGLLRQRPESSERIFKMELGELRALLDLEPMDTNRAVIRAVLKNAEEDVRWLHDPMNRILHLLCRKRANDLRPEILRKYPFDILSVWERFGRL